MSGQGIGDFADSTSANRRRIWGGILLFVVVTWVASAVFVYLQGLFEVDTRLLLLAQFGPAVGAVALFAVSGGNAAPKSSVSGAVVVGRIAAGAAFLVVLFMVTIAVMGLTGYGAPGPGVNAFGVAFLMLAAPQLVGAVGEELGWRVALQPHLQARWHCLVSSVVVGVLWGTWHIQYYAFGLVFMACFVITTVAISIIMGYLVRNTGWWSIVIAGVLHWLLNVGIRFLSDFETGDVARIAILAVTSAALTTIVMVVVRITVATKHRQRVGAVRTSIHEE